MKQILLVLHELEPELMNLLFDEHKKEFHAFAVSGQVESNDLIKLYKHLKAEYAVVDDQALGALLFARGITVKLYTDGKLVPVKSPVTHDFSLN